MTDAPSKTPIRALIEAVEAGMADPACVMEDADGRLYPDWWGHQLHEDIPAGYFQVNEMLNICKAYDGSLDAALALHEALLPDDYILAADTTGFAHVWRDEFELSHNWTALVPGKLARAALLATLRAYEAQK